MSLNELTSQLFKEYHDKLNELTELQFRQAIVEAVSSGDFMVHVIKRPTGYMTIKKDGGGANIMHEQAVTYLPYRKVTNLEMKITRLEYALNMAIDELSKYPGEENAGHIIRSKWSLYE
jgi:hypothetical protein